MAYFNNAFRKTMLMKKYIEVTPNNNTSELEVGQLALFNAKTFQGIDILTYNYQQKMPLKQYIIMFNSFKTIFTNDEFKKYYKNSLKKYKINFRNHNEMIIWYKNIGKHINKQFNA